MPLYTVSWKTHGGDLRGSGRLPAETAGEAFYVAMKTFGRSLEEATEITVKEDSNLLVPNKEALRRLVGLLPPGTIKEAFIIVTALLPEA